MLSIDTAVILAGGRSSRMGEDKALMPFGESSSLTRYQYRRLSEHFPRLYVSAKEDKFDGAFPLITDRYAVASPLAAIVSIFETLPETEAFFAIAVDMPFTGIDAIETLCRIAESEDSDIVAAETNGDTQPLCAVYKRSILPVAETMLRNDIHTLRRLLEQCDTRPVTLDEHHFINLNTPEAYREALRSLS